MLLQTGISPKGRRYGGFFGSHPRLQHSVHSDIVATLVLYEASIVRTYSSTQNTWENTSKPNIPSPGKRHPKIKKSGTGWAAGRSSTDGKNTKSGKLGVFLSFLGADRVLLGLGEGTARSSHRQPQLIGEIPLSAPPKSL